MKTLSKSTTRDTNSAADLLPGLPNDVAKSCLALVPRISFQRMGSVCKSWRNFLQSKEFYQIRRMAGVLEEWVYVLTEDKNSAQIMWQVFIPSESKWRSLPPMPGPQKQKGFGYTVSYHKLYVIGGFYEDEDGNSIVSEALYEYDSSLNRWVELPRMKEARFDFACTEIDGLIYVAGGRGKHGEQLSSVEVFNPEKNQWSEIESLRRPRWACFACGLEGKLYVMGGRSTFILGNSKTIELYDPRNYTWTQMRNGCVMVLAYAVLDNKLMCVEWKNERNLAIFDPTEHSWRRIPMPLTGSLTFDFCFGVMGGKLLLISTEREASCKDLSYDPNALPNSAWQSFNIGPLDPCLCSVTIVS